MSQVTISNSSIGSIPTIILCAYIIDCSSRLVSLFASIHKVVFLYFNDNKIFISPSTPFYISVCFWFHNLTGINIFIMIWPFQTSLTRSCEILSCQSYSYYDLRHSSFRTSSISASDSQMSFHFRDQLPFQILPQKHVSRTTYNFFQKRINDVSLEDSVLRIVAISIARKYKKDCILFNVAQASTIRRLFRSCIGQHHAYIFVPHPTWFIEKLNTCLQITNQLSSFFFLYPVACNRNLSSFHLQCWNGLFTPSCVSFSVATV